MNAIGFPDRRHMQCHVFPFPDAKFLRRLHRMAVGAADLAFGDLLEDRFPDKPGPRHRRNARPLVPQVVELKNDRIALAAINARVSCQVLPHAALVLFRADDSHLLYVSEMLVPVSQVPKALVFGVAGLAPRLTNTPLAMLEAELIDGFFDAAPSASSRNHRRHRTCILSLARARNNQIKTRMRSGNVSS